MTRLVVAAFLVAHGLVHAAIYAAPKPAPGKAPFDPSRSWALSATHVAPDTTREASVRLAWITAGLFVFAGAALLADLALWAAVATGAALVGLLLKVMWFHPWLTAGVLLDVGIVWATVTQWPPSLF